ncbi:hypothetical protein QJS66_17620 [Kocuria rhizophila]|nr:hypothetical protein QJS66_17620 [Kocuria rhizophila]
MNSRDLPGDPTLDGAVTTRGPRTWTCPRPPWCTCSRSPWRGTGRRPRSSSSAREPPTRSSGSRCRAWPRGCGRWACSRGPVAIVLPNRPQHIVAFYAVLRLGAIVAGTTPLHDPRAAPPVRGPRCPRGDRVGQGGVADHQHAQGPGREHVVSVDITAAMPAAMRLGLRLPLKKLAEQRRELTAAAPARSPGSPSWTPRPALWTTPPECHGHRPAAVHLRTTGQPRVRA